MPSNLSGGSCSISYPPASNVSAIMGCSRTGSARRSSGGVECFFSSQRVPHCLYLLLAKLLQHQTSQRRYALRASVGGCPGWKRSAASLTSSRGGCSHRAGILPDRTSRWADHVPLSIGEHVGSRTCTGRRTPSVRLGVLSSLRPGLGWPPLGVSRACLPLCSVLRAMC